MPSIDMKSNYDYIIGIDPGKDGAVAILDWHDNCEYFRLGKVQERRAMIALLTKTARSSFIVMEDVHSVYGAAAKSNFGFGRELGRILGILEALDVEPDLYVAPTKWQSLMMNPPLRPLYSIYEKKIAEKIRREHVKRLKAESIRAAKAAFSIEGDLHDGAADALNIARVGKLYLTTDMTMAMKPKTAKKTSSKKTSKKASKKNY